MPGVDYQFFVTASNGLQQPVDLTNLEPATPASSPVVAIAIGVVVVVIVLIIISTLAIVLFILV